MTVCSCPLWLVRGRRSTPAAKKRRAGDWVADTLKSAMSRRTVPLPRWLAERMALLPCADPPGSRRLKRRSGLTGLSVAPGGAAVE